MNEAVLEQLNELAKAFNKIGIEPVICGGLGVYLKFRERQNEIKLRATNDIDLMLTGTQVRDKLNRQAILKTIEDELQYVVRDDARYFMFERPPQNKLDILTPPVDGLAVKDFRVNLVKSKLHGYLTPEACFVEEDLETVSLGEGTIQLPSLMNLFILKLFAFNDRHNQKDADRAIAHACDIFIMTELSNRADYLQGREFITRHAESQVIRKAGSIVSEKFQNAESPGWQYVLRSDIYPSLEVVQRRQKLEHTARRLIRWFEKSDPAKDLTLDTGCN